MISVKLMGGMGNQMFQYAIARAMAIENNTSFSLDKFSFLLRRDLGSHMTYRNYDLDIFNICENFTQPPYEATFIQEPHFNYAEGVKKEIASNISANRNVYLDGYWQSFKYFQPQAKQIAQDFTFKNPISQSPQYAEILTRINGCNAVMLNARRTDYLKNNFHGVMGVPYFNTAKEIIKSRVSDPHFFVFSDDVEWCNKNLSDSNTTIVGHNFAGAKFDAYLQLMSSCKHFVIPNSTFAWWSAWLCNNIEKIVIAPRSWFADPSIDTNDLIPPSWIRI